MAEITDFTFSSGIIRRMLGLSDGVEIIGIGLKDSLVTVITRHGPMGEPTEYKTIYVKVEGTA